MAVCEPVASGAAAQAIEYGSFRFDPRLANVLFLVGEINAGDSFEMRRAMRDNNIRLVVTASGGGNLYEGLQLAAVLDDKGIATFLPSGLSCEILLRERLLRRRDSTRRWRPRRSSVLR